MTCLGKIVGVQYHYLKINTYMNKALLALKISEKLEIPKKQAEDFIAVFQEIVIHTLKHDEDVTIAGFGTFSSRVRAARKGVNPRNPSEVIDVPAVKVPKFKAGKKLKDELKASTPGKETNMSNENSSTSTPPPATPSTPEPTPAPAAPAAPPTTDDSSNDDSATNDDNSAPSTPTTM